MKYSQIIPCDNVNRKQRRSRKNVTIIRKDGNNWLLAGLMARASTLMYTKVYCGGLSGGTSTCRGLDYSPEFHKHS